MDPFLHVFQSKICSRLPSVPCMPHSSPMCQCSFIILVSDKQYKLWNSTLCILFFLFPLFLFKKLSWLLYIIIHWVSVSSSIRIWVFGLNDTYWQYNIPWHDIRHMLHLYENLLDHKHLYTQPRKYQQLRTCNRKSPLTQCVVVITAILTCSC